MFQNNTFYYNLWFAIADRFVHTPPLKRCKKAFFFCKKSDKYHSFWRQFSIHTASKAVFYWKKKVISIIFLEVISIEVVHFLVIWRMEQEKKYPIVKNDKHHLLRGNLYWIILFILEDNCVGSIKCLCIQSSLNDFWYLRILPKNFLPNSFPPALSEKYYDGLLFKISNEYI